MCKALEENTVGSVDYYIIKVVLEIPSRPRGACQTAVVLRLSWIMAQMAWLKAVYFL